MNRLARGARLCVGQKGTSRSSPERCDALRLVFDTAALRRRFIESFNDSKVAHLVLEPFRIFEDDDEDDWRRFTESEKLCRLWRGPNSIKSGFLLAIHVSKRFNPAFNNNNNSLINYGKSTDQISDRICDR